MSFPKFALKRFLRLLSAVSKVIFYDSRYFQALTITKMTFMIMSMSKVHELGIS